MSRASAVWLVACQTGGRRPQVSALAEQLDPPFGVLEPRVTELRQRDAPLVELERLFERQIAAFFQFLHNRLELGDRRFEVFDRGLVAHSVPDTLASISPWLKVTCTTSPLRTSAALRMARVRSSFQHTA